MMTKVYMAVFLIGLLTMTATTPALPQESAELKKLIEGARKEGELDLMMVSPAGEKGARAFANAFNRRFGLSLKVNADISGRESQKFSKAIAETKSGIPPTFDLLQGNAENVFRLKQVGGAERIDHWEKLLADISPEAYKIKDEVSPTVLKGYGFLYANRITVLLYNPKLISEQELPKTRKEMGDPKYAKAFSVPPWTSFTLLGLLKYDKGELLEITRSWGKMKAHVLNFRAGNERMLLGDIKFLPGYPHDFHSIKALDPNAPIGQTYFKDITTMSLVMYVLRKGASHPNAAKLFALWMTGEEANRLLEKHTYMINLALGSGPISKKTLKELGERNITPVSWFDNSEYLAKFRWVRSTKEGKQFAKAIALAQRRGK